jgi:centrosomal protein CEP135
MTEFVNRQRYQAVRKQLDALHYCLPFTTQSTELVERLLTDLLKTTEGYQKVKNELTRAKHDDSLNQQALVPLMKENERLTRENNKLHHEIIKVKEEKGATEYKWKQTLRQLQEECHDLKYLLDTKDARIRKSELEIAQLKTKMQTALEKIYMPSQDLIVEGLSNFNDRQSTNLI